MLDWNQTFETVAKVMNPEASRDVVVEGTYLAMRLMSHRALMAYGGLPPVHFLQDAESSAESRELALRVIREIERNEAAPLPLIPRERLDVYTKAMSEVVRRS